MKAIYVENGGFGLDNNASRGNGLRAKITASTNLLEEKDIIPYSMVKEKLSGTSTQFGNDVWIGDQKLSILSRVFFVWRWCRIVLFGIKFDRELGVVLASDY